MRKIKKLLGVNATQVKVFSTVVAKTQTILKPIICAGEATVPEKERHALRNFNIISAVTALMVVVFGGIIYSVVPSTQFLIGLILESSAFATLIYLNSIGKFEYSKAGMYLTHCCSAIYFGAWLGEALPVHMVTAFLFVYLIGSSCQVYKSWKSRAGFIAATLVLSAVVFINRSFEFIKPQHFPPEYLMLITILCCGGMLVLMGFVAVTMISQNDRLAKQAEEANLQKTKYVHETSHELRTPLNSIVGNTQLLINLKAQILSLKDGNDILKMLTDVNAASKIMTDMVNNQLDMAKIEAGKFDEANVTTFSLPSIFKTCIELNTTSAKRRDVRIVFRQDEQLNFIQSDELFLVKIVNNLLSNAIKFTEEGSEVMVSSTIEAGNILLAFENSSHLTKEKAANFFKAYHSERNLQTNGTGLGLVISKKLVELLGGSIVVETTPGHTRFMVRLPYTPTAMHTPASAIIHRNTAAVANANTPAKKPLDRVKFLIAEDDAMSNMALKRMLQDAGAIVEATESAEEAIVRLRDFSPDMIVSDNQMPGMGGMGLLNYIQALGQHIPIVIASASTEKDHRKAFLSAGAAGFILKPLDLASLITTLSGILEKYALKS